MLTDSTAFLFAGSLRRTLAGLFGGLTLLAAAAPARAQGDLLIAPTRVVLNGGGSTEVILNNIGTAPATYRISLELRRMTAEGELDDVADTDASAGEKAAIDMIRYAPRRILLPPGQPQSIRISARPAPDVPDGEYRVHMLFRAVPDEGAPVDESKAVTTQTAAGVTIKLQPIYGITIPVIVRKGQLQASAAIVNPHIAAVEGRPTLMLELTRSGTRSVFGEILVRPAGGGETLIQSRGIAVYPELQARTVHVPLTDAQQAAIKGRRVRIEYRELPENGGALIAAIDTAIG
jgi:hypothetical protein